MQAHIRTEGLNVEGVYVYVYADMYVNVHVHVYVSVSVYVCVYLCPHAHVRVLVCCVCTCVSLCRCVTCNMMSEASPPFREHQHRCIARVLQGAAPRDGVHVHSTSKLHIIC
jgi:hypothetical protein